MECYRIGPELEQLPPDISRVGIPTVTVLTAADEIPPLMPSERWNQFFQHPHTHFCKVEPHADGWWGTFAVPKKKAAMQYTSFAYLLTKEGLFFLDESGFVRSQIDKIARSDRWKPISVGQFFYAFLELLIEKDLFYLEELQDRILKLEDAALAGSTENFNVRMIAIRKEILTFYQYYSQLGAVGQLLQGNENSCFSADDLRLFRLFADQVQRFVQETEMLREYSMQVREVCQAQIDIRQNRIMKVLTIVTTIFLPLSLIAGWYGMNFAYMPELRWIYGYPMAAAISILVVFLCLWIFKKKKFW